MIKSIHGNNFIHVTGPGYTMPYIDSSRPSAGMVRYKDYTFEVYDGSVWQPATANAPTIGLEETAQQAINWALSKMREEETLKKLSENNQSIKIAYDNFKRAEEQLKTTIYLQHETTD
jgi:hypothetical protein